MASSDIYSALAALTPTYDSNVTVNVRWPTTSSDALYNLLDESDAPMRMLGVPDDVESNTVEFEFIALGAVSKRTYTILDRLWLLPAELNEGLQYNTPNLRKYIDSYNAQVLANRGLTSQSSIQGVTYSYGWHPWADSVVWFTVDAVVTVEEFCTP